VVAGLALTSALQRIIANAGSGDARTAAVAVAALVAAALVAAGIPALRILRVQPADALAER
jgi:ABC-type antimicrobial peptide transport system permease subunit